MFEMVSWNKDPGGGGTGGRACWNSMCFFFLFVDGKQCVQAILGKSQCKLFVLQAARITFSQRTTFSQNLLYVKQKYPCQQKISAAYKTCSVQRQTVCVKLLWYLSIFIFSRKHGHVLVEFSLLQISK